MPIRRRLALLFAIFTALATTGFGYLFVHELSNGLEHSVLMSLQTRTQTVLQQLPDLATTGPQIQQGSLGTPRRDLGDTQDVTQVLTANGRVVAASGPWTGRPVVGAGIRTRANGSPVTAQVALGSQHTPFLVLVTAVDGGGSIVVGQSLTTVDQAVHRVTLAIAAGGALAVVVTAGAAWFLASRALSPVERMRRQAEELSERDSTTLLSVPRSGDEIARLATTLNDLLARLHSALERERGFSSAAGHELRSPLAVLKAELQLAARPGRDPDYVVEAVRRATGEVDRVVNLADRLLLLSQCDDGRLHLEPAEVDVASLARDVVASLEPARTAAAVDVAVHAAGPTRAVVDPVSVQRIMANVVENAFRHGGRISRLDISVRRDTAAVEIAVADDGDGFPSDFLPHAFERFSRADPSRSRRSGGAGLGLSLVQSLVHAHGGSVEAKNGPDGGAVVTMRIPNLHDVAASPDLAGAARSGTIAHFREHPAGAGGSKDL